MIENRKFRLRVSYIKSGRLAYLSHLEVTRALERSVRRANLPFAVSEGFSPHMKLSFGSALPVGVGSVCEIFDCVMKDYIAAEEALSRLQASSPADLAPFAASYVANNATAASVAYRFSEYRALCNVEVPDFDIPETITVTRKKKEKVLNVDDYLTEMPLVDGKTIEFCLESKERGSLRADVLLKSFNLPCKVISLTRISQR